MTHDLNVGANLMFALSRQKLEANANRAMTPLPSSTGLNPTRCGGRRIAPGVVRR
jgi:hypothetical protein